MCRYIILSVLSVFDRFKVNLDKYWMNATSASIGAWTIRPLDDSYHNMTRAQAYCLNVQYNWWSICMKKLTGYDYELYIVSPSGTFNISFFPVKFDFLVHSFVQCRPSTQAMLRVCLTSCVVQFLSHMFLKLPSYLLGYLIGKSSSPDGMTRINLLRKESTVSESITSEDNKFHGSTTRSEKKYFWISVLASCLDYPDVHCN